MPDPTPDRCPHIHRDLTGRCFDCGYVDAEHRAAHLAEQAEHAARDAASPPIDWRARALAAEAAIESRAAALVAERLNAYLDSLQIARRP